LGAGPRNAGWGGACLANPQLAILPGLTHYTLFASPLVATVVKAFLDAAFVGS
jgi:hypothetical protein